MVEYLPGMHEALGSILSPGGVGGEGGVGNKTLEWLQTGSYALVHLSQLTSNMSPLPFLLCSPSPPVAMPPRIFSDNVLFRFTYQNKGVEIK